MRIKTAYGESARCAMPARPRIMAFIALMLAFSLACPAALAEIGADLGALSIDATARSRKGQSGFYIALPAYLYGRYSASGAQLGWQTGNIHLRLDASVIAEYENGKQVIYANPSLGAFYSEEWEARIRSYQGISIGIETGILNEIPW
jgi:hypothetical protein